MKKTIYLIVLAFSVGCIANRSSEKKLKQILVFESYFEAGKEGDKRLTEKSIYNEKGLLISEIRYTESGSVDRQNDYSYDTENRKIKDIYTLHGTCHSIAEFQYQKNDSISVIKVFKPTKKLDFVIRPHYDKRGFNDADLSMNADYSIDFRDEYKRNESGRLNQWIRYNPDSTIQSKVIYEYDKQNREIKNTCSGEFGGTYSFKYNKEGLKSEEMAYNTVEKTFLWLKVYSYDKSGRLTKVLEYNDPKHRPKNPYRISNYEYTFW
nr:hypothetical protein [uncultured Fluviicola sp.]